MENVVIKTENLVRTFETGNEKINAVDGVNVTFERGEFTAVVGPSGSGKTTLLNMIGGLDRPSAGKVWVNQTEIADLTDAELIDFRLKNIGFVFQAYNLIPVLSAKENAEFIMLLQGKSKKERDERVIGLLKEVGLADKMNNKPAELSGGQQQRVAVVRALASKPQFILADEPTANLDSKSTENLLDMMHKLNKEENITFIFSTHDQRVIDKAERVITLVDGKITQDLKKRQ